MVNNQGYYRGRNHLSICLQSYEKNWIMQMFRQLFSNKISEKQRGKIPPVALKT